MIKDRLNRNERLQQPRKRRWRVLGFVLIGVAGAAYWLDRKTSSAFEQHARQNLAQSSNSSVSDAPAPTGQSNTGSRDTGTVQTVSARYPAPTPASTSSAGSTAGAAVAGNEEIEEPHTAEEDERIVQGETGQLAGSRGSRSTDTSAAPAKSTAQTQERTAEESDQQLIDANPVPTITDGLVEVNGTHDCPEGFPIKGNASSRIYHVPGGANYDATVPEVCFATEEAASTAGYRPPAR